MTAFGDGHRQERLDEIRSRLGKRKLLWFGTRGLDAGPLTRLGLLGLVYCQISPLRVGAPSEDFAEDCLETRLGIREDLNDYDIDSDARIETVRFRQELLSLQEAENPDQEWLVLAYRPAEFLASLSYTRPRVKPAFMFFAAQRVFEHKPWVETQLREMGIKTLDWQYLRDGDAYNLRRIVDQGKSLVVRASRSDGGAKLSLVRTSAELAGNMPHHTDGFFAYAPYYENVLPLNLNACVYPNREVRVFPLSVQLIGLRECTTLPFGFCGNDFALASELDRAIMLEAELIAHRTGKWAADHGYVGQLGLDLLLIDGELRVTEINPRFQASTYLSEGIAEHEGVTGPYLEHMAAFLGMAPPSAAQLPDLATQVREVGGLTGTCDLSQIVYYNDRNTDVRLERLEAESLPVGGRMIGLPAHDVWVRPQAMLGKFLTRSSVTETGYDLREPYQGLRAALPVNQAALAPSSVP